MNKPFLNMEEWPNLSLKQIKHFEKRILSKSIKQIDPGTITRLLIGESENGLLKLIWESPTYIATQNLLSLLAKLLDYEKNIFAEAYNCHFAECSIDQIKDLKLDNHIRYQTANEINDGLLIVDQYIQTSVAQGNDVKVEDILISPDCIAKYHKWKES